MEEVQFEIVKNEKVGKEIFLLTLKGSTNEIHHAGEFVNVSIPGFYLRRPLSVCSYEENKLCLLYKVLGEGTKALSTFQSGMKLSILVGLGNGFDSTCSQKPLLIAGGIGIAPMVELAKEFSLKKIRPTLLYGVQTKSDFTLLKELSAMCDIHYMTVDGSYGFQGNVVEYLALNPIDFDCYYACGPLPMLKALQAYSTKGFLSLEARMGCGFGACMGCSIKTQTGPKRVCKEGPVFLASEVIF